MKRASVEHGSIRIRSVARGVPYPTQEGWKVIPAWSRGASPYNQLSPFHIKDENGHIFENMWQSYKVWDTVQKQNKSNWSWKEEKHVDEYNKPNNEWEKWHHSLKSHQQPVRRPNGRNIPLYAFFEGEELDVVQARKRIYIPTLQRLYRAHKVYQDLLQLVKGGQNIIIVEPDGCHDTQHP